MTVVYTLGKGSTWQNNELRYSIRSFVKYTAVTKIIVVGFLPDWIQNVEYIPFTDGPRKQLNIHLKTLAACQVADEFIQASDDHIILELTVLNTFYHSGLLKDKRFGGSYAQALYNTRQALNYDALYYNLHIPMKINAEQYKAKVCSVDWDRKEYLIKSLYANRINAGPSEYSQDVKITSHLRRAAIEKYVQDKNFLSFSDAGLSTDLRRWLAERFPDKSKYER